jgi:hypothetical protein
MRAVAIEQCSAYVHDARPWSSNEPGMTEETEPLPFPTTYEEFAQRMAGNPVFEAMVDRFERVGIASAPREIKRRLDRKLELGEVVSPDDDLERMCRDAASKIIEIEIAELLRVTNVEVGSKFDQQCRRLRALDRVKAEIDDGRFDPGDVAQGAAAIALHSLRLFRERRGPYSPAAASPLLFPIGPEFTSVKNWLFSKARDFISRAQKRFRKDRVTMLRLGDHDPGQLAMRSETVDSTAELSLKAVQRRRSISVLEALLAGASDDWLWSPDVLAMRTGTRERWAGSICDAVSIAVRYLIVEYSEVANDQQLFVDLHDEAVRRGLRRSNPDAFDERAPGLRRDEHGRRVKNLERWEANVSFAAARAAERVKAVAGDESLECIDVHAYSREMELLFPFVLEAANDGFDKRLSARADWLTEVWATVGWLPHAARALPWVDRSLRWWNKPGQSGLTPLLRLRQLHREQLDGTAETTRSANWVKTLERSTEAIHRVATQLAAFREGRPG